MRTVVGKNTVTHKLGKLKHLDRLAKYLILSKLKAIQFGRLEVIDTMSDESFVFGSLEKGPDLDVKVIIRKPIAYSKVAFGGSIGTGEAYIHEDFDVSNLTDLTRLFVRNQKALTRLDGGSGNLILYTQKLLHKLRSNRTAQAEQNIKAHYDLGNDFFKLFLDPSMMYSAGVYSSPTSTLADAQSEKLDRLCRKLNLAPHHHVLEIGTGWGGFALHAAKTFGCKVTTTTISEEQFKLASSRIQDAGLSDRVTVIKEDYRKLRGSYDKLVSIEMIEAVGLNYLDKYFEVCSQLLKENGDFALQAILISDQGYEEAAKSVDFIQTHVFPGSAIPSVSRIMQAIKMKTDLRLTHFEEFGQHYARTLAEWHRNLESKKAEIIRLGYPSNLYRHWHYYLSYCEGGFREKHITVGQFVFAKPLSQTTGISLA